MSLEPLSATTIQNGEAILAIDAIITKAAMDVIKRPGILTKRKATLTISICPDRDGGENIPKIEWATKESIPGRAGFANRGYVHNGRLMVNTDPTRQLSFLDSQEAQDENEGPRAVEAAE